MQTEVVLGKTPNKFLMCSMGFNLKKKIKILIYIIVSCFPINTFFFSLVLSTPFSYLFLRENVTSFAST